ncbi:amyloid protein-binding protein 2 [Phlebotomus argentipes]|uniref:amyloid protein-binding protein 2 n=1 Tax=Phlebotomus argentipes TaxID=94469 RepID=UPI0028932494|nr:amyloid protein-binding protein 2 [Phlebotomus argentipes]
MDSARNPSSLYELCLGKYVANLSKSVASLQKINALRLLPPVILAEIYYAISQKADLCETLLEELSDLMVFAKLLRFGSARQKLLKCVASLVKNNLPIVSCLTKRYVDYIEYRRWYKQGGGSKDADDDEDEESVRKSRRQDVDLGLRLGTFLSEAGWLAESIEVLSNVLRVVRNVPSDEAPMENLFTELDCLQRLLYAQANFCLFRDADTTYKAIIDKVDTEGIPKSLLANLYLQISVLFFARSEYDQSYTWSIRALKNVAQENIPDKVVIDVLLQAAKSCVVKRHFKKANLLIMMAVTKTRSIYGPNHQKYADALLDYGFYLLNVDAITSSVDVYNEALQIKTEIFGNMNLLVAVAHEDLAYALYVREYSSGKFNTARNHVESAITIMKKLVPTNHLMLASAKRVKALILEEIALDNMMLHSGTDHQELLHQSEVLHKSALELSLEAFGEINVQTAKHYGNLGRLYQSMNKFDDAERMHQRAIKIKTDLLGAYDYEVGLSIGHLASLYNYHMQKHHEAESLYLKSIEISLRLFGDSYSGLEYDYRGLCHVYESLANTDKYLEYSRILDTWRILRQENDDGSKSVFVELRDDTTMEEVTKKFFEMCSEPSNEVIATDAT